MTDTATSEHPRTDALVKQTRTRFKGPITFSAITDEASLPSRASQVDMTEYLAIVQASIDKVAAGHSAPAVGLNLPVGAEMRAEALFRRAARELGYALSVKTAPCDDPSQVRIVIEARTLHTRTRKPKDAEQPAETVGESNGKPAETVAPEAHVIEAPKGHGLPKVKR